MNELLGIEYDKVAPNIPPPPQDDFDLYKDDGTGPGPSICPMVPYWDNLKCDWNYQLYELFLTHLQAPAPEGRGIVLDNSDENEIEEMFFECLYRLKREIQAASPKHGEKAYQAWEHIAQKRREVLDRQQPNTRRKEVSESS
jgi:hypothetical protein